MYQRFDSLPGDKQDFDVSSEDPSSGISGPSLKTSKSCLSPRLGVHPFFDTFAIY